MLKHVALLDVALLGFLLLLTGCNNGDQVATLQARVDSLTAANQQLQSELQNAQSSASNAQSSQRVLEPAIYFPSGSAWLTDRGRRTLDSLASVIKQESPNHAFRIRGYSDNVPIGERLRDVYPSNWYLSAQRAAAVAHYLDTQHQIRSSTLEIGAYGPQEPAAPNETVEGRRQNRRVVIVLDEASPSS